MRLLASWLINALALLALPYLMHSIHLADFSTALVVALLLGLLNTLVRPVLIVLTLPVTILTLGGFILLLNGLSFWLVAHWIEGFAVAGFWSAVGGALLYSVISWALSTLFLSRT